jgi:D-tyrosyl-tRNA(Tyr) deacylase
MLTIIQRVSKASVTVNNQIIADIGAGLTALTAIHADDTPFDINWTAQKLTTIRIFPNADKAFDLDIKAVNGAILLISNFTVAADTASGRRPSLNPAAPPDAALQLFNALVHATKSLHPNTQTGQFAAEMLVQITNTGPATFVLDSRPARKV